MINKKRYLVLAIVLLVLAMPFVCAAQSEPTDSAFTSFSKMLWNGFYYVYSSLSGPQITGFVVADTGAVVGTLDFEEPAPLEEVEEEPAPEPEPIEEQPSELEEIVELTQEILETEPSPEVTEEGLELADKIQQKIDELSDDSSLLDTSGGEEPNTILPTQSEDSSSPESSFDNTNESDEGTTDVEEDSSEDSNAEEQTSEDSTGSDEEAQDQQPPLDEESTEPSEETTDVNEEDGVTEDSADNSEPQDDTTQEVEEEPVAEEEVQDETEEPQNNDGDQPTDETQDESDGESETETETESESQQEETPDPVDESEESTEGEEQNEPVEEESDTTPEVIPDDQDPETVAEQQQETSESQSETTDNTSENQEEPIDEVREEQESQESNEQPTQEESPGSGFEKPAMELVSDFQVGSTVQVNVYPNAPTAIFVTHNEVAYDIDNAQYTIPAEGEYLVTAMVDIGDTTVYLEEPFTVGQQATSNPTFIENVLEPAPPEVPSDDGLIAQEFTFTRHATELNYMVRWEAEIQGPAKVLVPKDAFNIEVHRREDALAQFSGAVVFNPIDTSIEVNGVEKSLEAHNVDREDEFEERKAEFEEEGEGSLITGFVVNSDLPSKGLIPRMFDAVYNWLFSGGITGNVVAVDAPQLTILELDEGVHLVKYFTVEYVVDPQLLDESYACEFESGTAVTITENMACYGLNVHLDSMTLSPDRSLVLKNSNLVVNKVVLDGTLHLEGQQAAFIVNEDMKVNNGGQLVMNHSSLVLNVSEEVVPRFDLVPGARMIVTKNSRIVNGVEYGGLNETFQFVINAREYKLS